MDVSKITIGALLHDIGKVIFRSATQDKRAHSVSGKDFIKEIADDKDVLEAIGFHHKAQLKNAEIADNSSAYIVYIADNIASGADRRGYEETEDEQKGYKKDLPLESIFNLLNNRNNKQKINLSTTEKINFPDVNVIADESTYNMIFQKIKQGLQGIHFEKEYENSLLELLEATLSFVPSSTNIEEVADISLYDHSKITAAFASCIYLYLQSQGRNNYKQDLFIKEKDFYSEKAFLMFSCDISGIQQFIYTISSEKALKALRSRSFYLEILMENLIDELLKEIGLSRANLIYSGGGHCYILLPNTQEVKLTIEKSEQLVNQWLFNRFKTSLYIAISYVECSASELMNEFADDKNSPYKEIFRKLSQNLSEKKLRRYNSESIRKLNSSLENSQGRECKVCGTIDNLTDKNNICVLCDSLIDISSDLVKEDKLLLITKDKMPDNVNVQLPTLDGKSFFLNPISYEKVLDTQKNTPESIVRVYGKNKVYTGLNYASKLWIGTYYTLNINNDMATFEELAGCSEGVNRIAVLRADVDNLGKAFIKGFERNDSGNKYRYVTLSRYATLSRQLSLFFKKHINEILSSQYTEKRFLLTDNLSNDKKVTIVYSGGDDLFIVGAWNQVIETAVDLRNAFQKYTGGALSFSAGIGIYESGYPISRMADEVAVLEEAAKGIDNNKNAISLFGAEIINDKHEFRHTYKWEEFLDFVVGEKFRLLQKYFLNQSNEEREKGNSFLYKLLEYFRSAEDRINVARCAYLLGRMAPSNEASDNVKRLYSEFSQSIYSWILKEKDRRQLITAVNLYVYLYRDNEKEEK